MEEIFEIPGTTSALAITSFLLLCNISVLSFKKLTILNSKIATL